MGVNIAKLCDKMTENGFTQEELARMLSLDNDTFHRKMRGFSLEFSVGEMHALSAILGLTKVEASEIFLNYNSH